MITLNASGGSVTFTFSGNSTYLNDGTITVPVNSLALIIDESDMVTFKKSHSNDIFVSANIAEFGMTKAELETWFKENAVGSTGGGGVTPEEVEEMIDEAISGITVSGVTEEELNEAIASAKTEIEAEIPTVPTSNTAFTNDAEYATSGYVDSSVSGKVDTATYNAYTAATDTALASKQTTLTAGTNITIVDNVISAEGGGTDTGTVQTMIDQSISGKADSSAVTEEISAAVSGKLDVSAFTTYSGAVDTTINSKASQDSVDALNGVVTAHTADTTIHVTSAEKNTWNAKSDFSGNYNDLTSKPTIPTNTSDLTNDSGFVTSGYVDSAVSGKVDTSVFEIYSGNVETELSGKQDTLSAGTGIDITDNVISATGGGGGGMTEDDELLLATALVELKEEKIDAKDANSKFQLKGDYVTTNTLNNRLADYETALDEQNVEEVASYALNDLNTRFGGLTLVKLTQSEYTALTDKDENTLYIVIADPI